MDKADFPMTEAELELEIVVRDRQGDGIRKIHRDLKVDRKKIRRTLQKYRSGREQCMDALEKLAKRKRASKLDSLKPRIREFLLEFPDMTAVRIHEELAATGYKGGLTIIQEYVRTIRPKPKKDPVIRFETDPGEQGQMDWSPYRIEFHDGPADVLCFSYILGYSRRQYIDFTKNRNFHTLVRRHNDAFQYFGGVPQHCLYDNEKTVVNRWEAGHPIYNPAFLRFSMHYGTRPVACKPRRPQTKGKIEQPFQNIEGNLFNGRKFWDFNDLRQTARWWLENWSDKHKHRTTGRPPLELFLENEKDALIELPAHRYDASEVGYRVCDFDGTIVFQTNIYSIPFEYGGMILVFKADEREIRIFSPDLREIAHHERLANGAGRKVESPQHRLSQKHRYGLEPIRRTFLDLGEDAEVFLLNLKRDHPRRAGINARSILALKETYHSQDINRALRRAHRYHAYEADAVANILKAKATPRHLENSRKRRFSQHLAGIAPNIEQRDLAEYSLIF
jgi:transposase